MRFFNTAGPVRCEEHYCLSPLGRLDLTEILSLIAQKKYFVLHAPRQTGKTSCLLALMDYLNATGSYRCLYFNVESAQAAREDVRQGMRAILSDAFMADFKDDFPTTGRFWRSGEYGTLQTPLGQKSPLLIFDR
jgi:hypothetical protein